MKRPLLLGAVTVLALTAGTFSAQAQDTRPVIVEYLAPMPECASADTFQRLVQTEVTASPTGRRRWRFSVRVRRGEGGGFVGTLTTEEGSRSITAAQCDAVTAALAASIAHDEIDPAAPEAPPCVTPPLILPPPLRLPSASAPPPPPDRPAATPRASSGAEWSVGLRADVSNHGVDGGSVAGALAVVSLEVKGGLDKMLFEVAAGGSSATDSANQLRYTIVDTQACPLDVRLGSDTFRFLGCLRLAVASFSSAGYELGAGYAQGGGGALWTGVGGRIRWQTPFSLYLEAALNGVYGTVSGGESTSPGWVDGSLGVGLRL